MTKEIVFLKHIDLEGPGTLELFFRKSGFKIDILDLEAGDKIPKDVHRLAAVVSLGGPMNVYEEDKYPFLKQEDIFIKKILQLNIPFLGICLGSQLLAKACGAKVGKSPKPEIGFFDVALTEHGQRDTLFRNIKPFFKVFQWHEDMFEIPENALWLSKSLACPHQAFRAGTTAYGFQFHAEINREMIVAWMKKYWKLNDVLDCEKARKILSQYDEGQAQLRQIAQQIYKNFVAMIDPAV